MIRSEDGKEEVRTQSFQPAADGSFQVELPLGAEDFRGLVRTEVYDWAGHCMARERNYAVESESLHRTAGTAELAAVTPPSRIVDGTAYYNTDLTVRLTLRDTFSGLQTVWYTGGRPFQAAGITRQRREMTWTGKQSGSLSMNMYRN